VDVVEEARGVKWFTKGRGRATAAVQRGLLIEERGGLTLLPTEDLENARARPPLAVPCGVPLGVELLRNPLAHPPDCTFRNAS
jgi:hypothetical protein